MTGWLETLTASRSIGEVLALSSGLVWAVAVVLFRVSGRKVHPVGLNLFKTVLAFVFMAPTMLILREPLFPAVPVSTVALLLLSGALGIALPTLCSSTASTGWWRLIEPQENSLMKVCVGPLGRMLATLAINFVAGWASLQATAALADDVGGAWLSQSDDNWPLIAMHATLMPDGRVVSYGSDGAGRQTGFFLYDVWEPVAGVSGGHTTLENRTGIDIFCSAHLVLPSTGQLRVAGGTTGRGSPRPTPATRAPASSRTGCSRARATCTGRELRELLRKFLVEHSSKSSGYVIETMRTVSRFAAAQRAREEKDDAFFAKVAG